MSLLTVKNIHKKSLGTLLIVICLLPIVIAQCGQSAQDHNIFTVAQKYLFIPEERPASMDFFGKSILALYKSSDGQAADDNEIHNFLAPVLTDMGFTVTYWDVDEAVPTVADLGGIRAVVSWFRGGTMEDPDSYLAFLDQTINSGRKVIIIDNMGAYEYKTTDKPEYVDRSLINLTLGKLGLWYMSDWTDDTNVIRIARKVPEIVEKGGEQDAAKSAFYYRFMPVDKDLQVYLSLTRSDKNYPPSPVIVSNKHGGFILSRYIYRMQDGKAHLLIDFKKYFHRALFTEADTEQVALFTDQSDPDLARLAGYAEQTLKRVGLDVSLISKKQFTNLTAGDLLQFTAIGLVLKNDDGLSPELFSEFFAAGGGLADFVGGSFPLLAPVLGATAGNPTGGTAPKGYTIRPGFVLGQNIALKDAELPWAAGLLVPRDNVTIIGTDASGSVPLVWSAGRANGKIIVWNWDGFVSGSLIGLMLESFLYVRPVGAALTLGIGHMFIDDWPAPMYNSVKDPVTTTDTVFYTTVWWPDVKNILDSRHIKYSTYMIFNYNDIVSPPFTGGEFFIADNMASVQMARDILAQGTELELHGYNHMSLTREKTKVNKNSWPSIDNMIDSLEHGRKTWINLFGRDTLPFAYVAVNNIISQDGIVALHKVFPGIKIISALHWGVGEETFTPIGPHPVIPDIYYFPRLTYGYRDTPELRNVLVSGMCGPGLISHFIHPDDVYDSYRSGGKNWPQLKQEFQGLLDFAQTNYPWVTWLSLHAAYERLQFYDSVNSSFRWRANTLTVSSYPGLLLRIRTNGRRLLNMQGAKPVYQYANAPFLILRTTAVKSVLTFAAP
ncbi:MAG: DUF2194 domain-containing protein [Spirochaetia bacterium]